MLPVDISVRFESADLKGRRDRLFTVEGFADSMETDVLQPVKTFLDGAPIGPISY